MTTEVEKLTKRLEGMGATHFNTSWGPEAYKLTEEERAAVLNKMFDQVEEDLSKTVTIPVSQLVDIADALHKVSDLGKVNIQEIGSTPKEVFELKRQILDAVDMVTLFAEQWLPLDMQKDRSRARLAKLEKKVNHNAE